MLGEKPKIMSLDEVGTRFDHYMELRELFADGIEVIKSALVYQPNNELNKRRLDSLQHAVNEITRRLEVLSGFEENSGRWSKFGRELDSIQPNRTSLLSEGSNVSENKQNSEVKPLPPCPNRISKDNEDTSDYCC